MPEAPEVSVVVPVLDEAPTLRELAARVARTLEDRGRSFELVFVDDGSRDGSDAILADLERGDPRVRVFRFTRTFGQAAALACGVFAARGAVVVSMDGDLQNPPEEIPRLLEAVAKDADVASARRTRRHESVWRWLGSRAVHRVACWLTGARLDDFGGQFKAYRRPVVEAVRRSWGPGKPLFPLAVWLGFAVTEVSVRHEPRRQGRSRYTLRSLLRINVDLITAFSTLPLALLGVVGAGAFAAGLVLAAACALLAPAGWLPGALALVLTGAGALLFGMGVLGQYLARVYGAVTSRSPGWVVRRGPLRDAPGGGELP